MQPLEHAAVRALALAAGTMALLACGKSDTRRVDDGTVSAKLVSAVPTATAPQPGALGKALDQYSGDELYAFTHRLTFAGGNERARRCRGRAACRGALATQSTRLRVDAVDTQDSVSARTLPTNGVVAARIINRGQMADTMYGTRPGAQNEYYLIVAPGTQAGVARWSLVELVTTTGARTHRTLTTGRLTECNHPFKRGARADFKTCSQAAPIVRPASFTKALQGDGESPIWIACALGCCTADPPDGRG
jgi:hypothetical protein